MKILVLLVINSSRYRNCFVRGYIHSFVSKALTRTSLVRVFTQTTREYNPVRRTFYDVNHSSPTTLRKVLPFFFCPSSDR